MTGKAEALTPWWSAPAGPGLGASHALAGLGLRHRVLERGRIGETWRAQRCNSPG